MSEITCYECGNMGHYRSDCPKLKKDKKGREKEYKKDKKQDQNRSFTATWSDSDESSEEE
jgi:hypothetical protein